MTSEGKKILILGGSGYIGRHLYGRLGPEKSVATFNSRPFEGGVKFDALTMSLSDLDITGGNFSHAVIMLGLTNIDACAKNEKESSKLNVLTIKKIIDELVERDVFPIFTSSEMVFDGSKGQYVETDSINPKVMYGRQKAEIENHILKNVEKFIIMRLAKVYGSTPGDFSELNQWYNAIHQGAEIVCAHDYVTSPIHVDDLIDVMLSFINKENSGIYHSGGSESLSRLEMFNVLLDEMNKAHSVVANMRSCSVDDIETIEGRPHDISMDSSKAILETGISPRDVRTSCREFVDELAREATKVSS